MWIKSAQREAFPADICNLTDGKPVGMTSRFKTVTPLMGESDILRVGGRIDRAAVCYDVKHPMIIPQDHHQGITPNHFIISRANLVLPYGVLPD